jgi:hypothetical protein
MVDEKSNIEILREFAKSTNRTIVDEESMYPLTGFQTFRKYRRKVIIPYNSDRTSFFIWFSDPYAKIGLPTIFCGVFIPVSSKINDSINIRKKNILDSLNIFSKNNVDITGNNNFESKVKISGTVNASAKRFLAHSKFQNQVLKFFEISDKLIISFNEHNVDFVPELKSRSYISVINPDTWCLKDEEIEIMFNQMEKVRNTISL